MTVNEYTKLPYHMILVRDESEDGQIGWVASVAELPGCLSQGDTPEEAAAHIQDAMETWFEAAIEKGVPIPPPAPESTANGRILARIPVTLHERLLFEAQREGVSLNHLVSSVLAASVGWKAGVPQPAKSYSRQVAIRATQGRGKGIHILPGEKRAVASGIRMWPRGRAAGAAPLVVRGGRPKGK